MATTAKANCLVFVRYWPGFTKIFPYERFNALPDDSVERELRAALAKELWRQRYEITRKRREKKRKRFEALKVRRARSLSRPSGAYLLPLQRREKPPETRARRFVRFARYVGWNNGEGPVTDKTGEFLCSRRIWIMEVESADFAEDLVKELIELPPDNAQEWERHRILNPRYGMVSCDDLSIGARSSALSAIEQLWSNGPVPSFGDIVRPILPRVDRFIGARRAIVGGEVAGAGDDAHSAVHYSAEGAVEKPPDSIPDSGVVSRTEHNWPLIVGTSRQLLGVLRTIQGTAPPDPARSREDSLQFSAVRHEIGNLWTLVGWWFTRDPRTNGCHTKDQDTADMLWLCYQECTALRSAALRLWRFYHQVITPRLNAVGQWPQYTDAELVEFEGAIEALAKTAEADNETDQATDDATPMGSNRPDAKTITSSEVDGERDRTSEPDGPCHPFTWRQNGKVIDDKMEPAPWRLVNYLWLRPSRTAHFDELRLPVYEDADYVFDSVAIGSLRREANRFFAQHGIPLRVSLKATSVSLKAKIGC